MEFENVHEAVKNGLLVRNGVGSGFFLGRHSPVSRIFSSLRFSLSALRLASSRFSGSVSESCIRFQSLIEASVFMASSRSFARFDCARGFLSWLRGFCLRVPGTFHLPQPSPIDHVEPLLVRAFAVPRPVALCSLPRYS